MANILVVDHAIGIRALAHRRIEQRLLAGVELLHRDRRPPAGLDPLAQQRRAHPVPFGVVVVLTLPILSDSAPKTMIPPAMQLMLAAVPVIAMTGTASPSCRPRADAKKAPMEAIT